MGKTVYAILMAAMVLACGAGMAPFAARTCPGR